MEKCYARAGNDTRNKERVKCTLGTGNCVIVMYLRTIRENAICELAYEMRSKGGFLRNSSLSDYASLRYFEQTELHIGKRIQGGGRAARFRAS